MSDAPQHPLRGEDFEPFKEGDVLTISGEFRRGDHAYFYRSGENEWIMAPLAQEHASRFHGSAYRVREIKADGTFALDHVDLAQAAPEPSEAEAAWLQRLETDAEFAAHLAEKFSNPKDAPVFEVPDDACDDPSLREAREASFEQVFGQRLSARSRKN